MNHLVIPMVALFCVSALLTYLLAGQVRRYALARGILDHPNARSSHQVPTPRGGGLAIVGVVLVGVVMLAVGGWVNLEFAVAFVVGGAVVAVVGWLDDRFSLPILTRATIHTAAAVWALGWLGGLPRLTIGTWVISLGLWGFPLGLVAMVWLINLYNFMDGIDGLAGMEAVAVALAAGVLALLSGDNALALVAWLVAGASLGFLGWNWPPAKIFMGDVGSAFLGYAFAVMAVAGESTGSLPVSVWCVLLAVFVADTTLTLVRRFLSGEKWYEAHRSHVYQLAVRAGCTHRQVTLSALGLNITMIVVAAMLWVRPALGQWLALGATIVLICCHVLLYRRYVTKISPRGSVARRGGQQRRRQAD